MEIRKICLVLALLVLMPGCTLFNKGSKATAKRPQETSIAAATAATYKDRWVEIRKNQLTAQGIAGDAAIKQAESEFDKAYPGLQPLR